MESYYNARTDYLEMGVGPICKTANLGDVVYNDNYKFYNKTLDAGDQSEPIPGAQVIWAKGLTNDCIPPPPAPAPEPVNPGKKIDP